MSKTAGNLVMNVKKWQAALAVEEVEIFLFAVKPQLHNLQ